MPASPRLQQMIVVSAFDHLQSVATAVRHTQDVFPGQRCKVHLAAYLEQVADRRRNRHKHRSHPSRRRSSRIVSLRSISAFCACPGLS